jgi:soluble lytic murein transglycosylase-like protein
MPAPTPRLSCRRTRFAGRLLLAAAVLAGTATTQAQGSGASATGATGTPPGVPALTLESLPRPATPPAEVGPVVPSQVLRWREEAQALEHGDSLQARDPVRAAQLYCRAARYGDAESQYSLAWMLTNARGIERDEAQAAHLFAAAAEQGHAQAMNMAARLGTPLGPPPACLHPPEADAVAKAPPVPAVSSAQGTGKSTPFTTPNSARPTASPSVPLSAAQAAPPAGVRPGAATAAGWPLALPPPPPPANAPEAIVRFVQLVAPEYQLQPHLVLAVMEKESNFDPLAVSPKNAQGLMQLIPDTAARFKVKRITDPTQNIRGGMAYLRWLMAYFEGDLAMVLAAYNAGERAVERYRGVPPYAETRMYVRRIIAAINGQRTHPFDPAVTAPSEMLAQLRPPAPGR